MTNSERSVIEKAREAARYSFKPRDTDTASPLLVDAFREVAQRGGDYAMRALLIDLSDTLIANEFGFVPPDTANQIRVEFDRLLEELRDV